MAHIKLALYVKAHPHASKLRKRRKKLKPVRPSRATELWYKSELLKVVRFIRSTTEAALTPLIKHETFRGDAALPSTMAHKLNEMSRKFGGISKTAQRLSRLAVQKNLGAVDDRLIKNIKQAVGVDIRNALTNDGVHDVIRKATKANIELIASIPDQYFDKLGKALTKNWEAGSRWETLVDTVKAVGDVTESRAKLIARDQTSKMNSAFNQARQTSIGIEKYEWQTAGDERVRESHADMDGQICLWDDPPDVDGEPANPGEPINCRCVAVPFFDLDSMEDEL
jgi:SPP1 gp7 family putative phage head morphogenesis protein